jgi:hypothetical protein
MDPKLIAELVGSATIGSALNYIWMTQKCNNLNLQRALSERSLEAVKEQQDLAVKARVAEIEIASTRESLDALRKQELAEGKVQALEAKQELLITATIDKTRFEDLTQFFKDLRWKDEPERHIRHEGIFNKRYYVRFEATLLFREFPITPAFSREIYLGNELNNERIDQMIKAALTIGSAAAGIPALGLSTKSDKLRELPGKKADLDQAA